MNFGLGDSFARAIRWAGKILWPIWKFYRRELLIPSWLGVCWLTYFYFDSSAGILLWLPGIYLAFRRGLVFLIAFLLLTPLSIVTLRFAREYVEGSPTYVNGQDPIWLPFASIDPVTRIRTPYYECGNRSFGESINRTCRSWAGTAMFAMTGPPPGAYAGPYPTEPEAVEALASAMKFQMPDTWNGEIPLATGPVVVDTASFRFRNHGQSNLIPPPSPDELMPSAVVWKGRCLIVRVPREFDGGLGADIYLIDFTKLQPIGMYRKKP